MSYFENRAKWCDAPSLLRAREKIPSHFRLPSSSHLEPIFTRTILNVGFATPAVVLPQIDPIWPKPGREFSEVILSRALRLKFPFCLAEGELEVMMEGCDAWISDIVLHILPSDSPWLNRVFSGELVVMAVHPLFASFLAYLLLGCGIRNAFDG